MNFNNSIMICLGITVTWKIKFFGAFKCSAICKMKIRSSEFITNIFIEVFIFLPIDSGFSLWI